MDGIEVFADWSPTAVVFDCDGLLVDTEPCWTVAETEVYARRGLTFGPAEKEFLLGRSIEAVGEELAKTFDEPGQAAAIGAELQLLTAEVIAAEAEPMPGAHELVELIAARVPVAVASNSSRHLLRTALQRGGFGDAFSVSVAGDEVERPKPAPDIYLLACERLGAKPQNSLAFEDSATGARSALGAGLRLISVPTFLRPDFPGDWVLPSLKDPDLGKWIAGWPRSR